LGAGRPRSRRPGRASWHGLPSFRGARCSPRAARLKVDAKCRQERLLGDGSRRRFRELGAWVRAQKPRAIEVDKVARKGWVKSENPHCRCG
jgi:hypothetical protein